MEAQHSRPMRVLFHRNYDCFRGGHFKVWHYFNHVKATSGVEPAIYFTPDSTWDANNPWQAARDHVVAEYAPDEADILFVAGMDWTALPPAMRPRPPVPVINLLQHVRHADPTRRRYDFLKYPAIRIAVSEQVKTAVLETGQVNGPVYTIPNGIRLDELPASVPWSDRAVDVVVGGLKQPELAHEVAATLEGTGTTVRLLVDRMSRPSYLQALQEAKVAVLIPNHTEGFFLPALETMALDVITVCPDCVGNRTFCADGQTAIMPGWEPAAIVDAAERALRLPNAERQSLLHRARKMAERHTLERERTAFQRVLRGLRSGEITPPPGLPDWIPTFAARWWA